MAQKKPTKRATKRPAKKQVVQRKAAIVVWKSKKNKKFYFHLRSSNGKVMVDNGQGYERRVDLIATLEAMINIFKAGRYEIQEVAV